MIIKQKQAKKYGERPFAGTPYRLILCALINTSVWTC